VEDIRLVGAVSHSGSGERTKGRGGPLCSTAVGPASSTRQLRPWPLPAMDVRRWVPSGVLCAIVLCVGREQPLPSFYEPAVLRIGATETARKLHAGTKAQEDHQATRAAHQAEMVVSGDHACVMLD
jgi:hypothetical protein